MATVSRSVSYWAVSGTNLEAGEGAQATLRYDSADPHAVRLDFGIASDGQPTVWTFARDLLADGLSTWSGYADVTCWSRGPYYFIGLRNSNAQCVLKLLAEAVRAFLIDTEDAVPYGSEAVDFDTELDALLKDDAR